MSIIPLFAYGSDNLRDLEVIGKPEPGGINFQPAVTELARDIRWLDNFLLVIITLISLFVIILLGIVALRIILCFLYSDVFSSFFAAFL